MTASTPITNTLTKFLPWPFSRSEKKEEPLDPMLTLICIGLLRFEPEGTKIGFIDFSVKFYPPTKTQWLERNYDAQGHEDLKQLGEIIRKAVFQYGPPESKRSSSVTSQLKNANTSKNTNTSDSENSSSTTPQQTKANASKNTNASKSESSSSTTPQQTNVNVSNSGSVNETLSKEESIKIIFDNAIEGLKILQKTYPNSNVAEAAKTWIGTLSGELTVENPPEITQIAKTVQETWSLLYFSKFANLFKQAVKDLEHKDTSQSVKESFMYTIDEIKALAEVKRIEFKKNFTMSISM